MRWFRLAVLGTAAVLAGCGDPQDDTLRAGDFAVVAGDSRAMLEDNKDTDFTPMLDPGTRVLVGDDPRSRGESDPRGSRLRRVSVVVETGQHKGLAGKISRRDLRLVK